MVRTSHHLHSFTRGSPFTPHPRTSPSHLHQVEVLFLSPLSHPDPSEALARPAHGQLWRAMVRAPLTGGGATLTVASHIDGGAAASSSLPNVGGLPYMGLRVEDVITPWIEQGEPDGVEAAVRISSSPLTSGAAGTDEAASDSAAFDVTSPSKAASATEPLAALLSSLGQTPLPPYLQRAATPEDVLSYQTVYAADTQARRSRVLLAVIRVSQTS